TDVHVMAAHPGGTDTDFFAGTTHTMNPRRIDAPADVARRTLDDYARRRSASYPGRPLNRIGSWLPASSRAPRPLASRPGSTARRAWTRRGRRENSIEPIAPFTRREGQRPAQGRPANERGPRAHRSKGRHRRRGGRRRRPRGG